MYKKNYHENDLMSAFKLCNS